MLNAKHRSFRSDFNLKALVIKPLFLVACVLLVILSSSFAADRKDLFITQIAVHPLDHNIVYAVTTYSIGVLKSTDGGLNWSLINQGIKSYSLYHFAVDPRDLNLVYLGAGGGGLYKSGDGGAHWLEKNNGLQDTDIGQMFLHPKDPQKIYIVCATGTYRSVDGGNHWEAWNQGDTFTMSQEFQNIVIMPGKKDRFFLASKHGLFTRSEGDPSWKLASKELEGKLISALAVDPTGQRLYAAVLRDSKTLLGGGLFVSDDLGKHWKRVDNGLERDWVRVIRFDPAEHDRVYLATSNRGVLVSSDGGKNWQESNQGLNATDLRVLVIDPTDAKILFAGAHGEGIFKSTDRGATWIHLENVPTLDSKEIIAQLTTQNPNKIKPELVPPPAFSKCNKCHGWTDPYLNSANGFWLVPPNQRNWSLSVKRMSKGAALLPEEEKSISDFLQAYSKKYGGTP